MQTIDFIVIGVGIIAILLGAGLGFGKVLTLTSKGLIGKIFTFIICYFIFGLVLETPFVVDLLDNFVGNLKAKQNAFCNFLILIRIDLIVFAIVLFIIVFMLMQLLTLMIEDVFESDGKVMQVVNKTLGVILSCLVFIITALIYFQIAYLISGTNGATYRFLEGSFFRIDKLYLDNPLNSFIELIKNMK